MLDGVMKFGVGQPVRRKEDDRFLRGAGQFVDDITEPGQAYAVFLRSPAAHAKITALDVAAARGAPGVLAVYIDSDARAAGMKDLASLAPIANADGSDIAPVTHPHLARGRVRYVGQPVAMVVAESLAQARDAAEMINLKLEDLPAVVDLRAALADGAPLLHNSAPNNRSYQWEVGDKAATEAAFAAADHVVTERVVAQRLIVNAMEPRAVNVKYDDGAGRWTVTCATQGSHAMRARISSHLGVEAERVRVITPDVGGGFGMKLMVHPEYAVCAMAAQKLGRPVKWTADRTESFLSDAQARDLWAEAAGAFDADGRLLAMRFHGLSGLGAYYSQVGAAIHTIFSAPIMGGMYRLPTAYAQTEGVFTNTTPTDAYRGAGRPEVINLTEMVMDKAARAVGLDPAELRRRNLLTAADMPYKTWSGASYDSGDCVATLDQALEIADYRRAEVRREQARARGRLWGVGVVYYMERTGGGPNEVARIRIRGNGRVEALIGTQSTGQGHETAWAQIIHEKLGVDISVIDFAHGDSDALPLGGALAAHGR
ncbi:MAG: xanthine dehydrogenase family protein molybdopterin-binding subunit [Rhodobacteraceae bacterium]|nr:xanthine dehydrogenase family protein molybdopterin-binding subunit [Paracoccaceae bacterium]